MFPSLWECRYFLASPTCLLWLYFFFSRTFLLFVAQGSNNYFVLVLLCFLFLSLFSSQSYSIDLSNNDQNVFPASSCCSLTWFLCRSSAVLSSEHLPSPVSWVEITVPSFFVYFFIILKNMLQSLKKGCMKKENGAERKQWCIDLLFRQLTMEMFARSMCLIAYLDLELPDSSLRFRIVDKTYSSSEFGSQSSTPLTFSTSPMPFWSLTLICFLFISLEGFKIAS